MAPSTAIGGLAATIGLWALTVSGCGPGSSGPAVSVTDSAGVPLYSLSALPPWDDPSFRWQVTLERSIRRGLILLTRIHSSTSPKGTLV
jgi:hypothetical protein